MPYLDSTGRLIKVGDRVLWRSNLYTIKAFRPDLSTGVRDCCAIEFNEPLQNYQDSQPDEWSVDLR